MQSPPSPPTTPDPGQAKMPDDLRNDSDDEADNNDDDPYKIKFKESINHVMAKIGDISRPDSPSTQANGTRPTGAQGTKFNEALAASVCGDLFKTVTRERFWKSGNRYRQADDGQTYLHQLAEQKVPKDWISTKGYQMFVGLILSGEPDIMGYLDNDQRTPLGVAAKHKNYPFIFGCSPNANIRDAVRERLKVECADQRNKTCLDMAIDMKKSKLRIDIRLLLISLSPKEAFERISNGYTPLHEAVAHFPCSQDQVKLVQALIKYGSSAMDIRTTSPLHQGLSVYQYQQASQRSRYGKIANVQNDRRNSLQRAPTFNQSELQSMNSRGADTLGDQDSKAAGENKIKDQLSGRDHGRNVLAAATQRNAPNTTTPTVQIELNTEEECFNEIGRILKLWYLRNKTPNEAVEYVLIRGQKSRKDFWFDLGLRTYEMTENQFKKNFEFIEFDECLKYVNFPEGALIDCSPHEGVLCSGRKDMLIFFDWLFRRNVRYIINVVVDDQKAPHADEAIESALSKFRIEVLDWRKIDLDTEVIQKVGQDTLREVHLHWSGNRTALRAWSGPQGLKLIKTLETIHLYVNASLDSDQRRKHVLDEFERDLKSGIKNPPALNLHDIVSTSKGETGTGAASTGQGQLYSHRWLSAIGDFVRIFKYISPRTPHSYKLGDPIAEKLLNPVIVALIDDGIELPHENQDSYKYDGRSFQLYEGGSKVEPWWNSTAGHGTIMARLIRWMCPNAMIYAIRLETQRSKHDENKIQVVPESAIQAIHHAVDQRVDIISMSWTCPMPNDAIEQRRWERAIDAAAEKDILMFCSAADAGQFGETTFPHHCRPKTTFRVGAAHDTGQIYEHVANADKLDFAMPGFELFLPDEEGATNSRSEKSRDSSAIHVDKENPLESYTGSSVATALAAGLAALVLECVRIGCARDIETERDSDGTIVLSDLAVIRQRENLKTAFTEGIGTSKDSGQNMDKFIMANNIFAEYYRKLDTEDDDNRRETIATLARELLRKRW